MKTRFFALAALVLGLASCQNDFEGANISTADEVDFRLAVGTPELVTRAGDKGEDDGIAAYDSAYGAIDYLQACEGADAYRVDWTEVDLRYTMEVYDAAADYAGATPVKKRMVKIVDKYEPIVFDLRLIPNRDYRFVVFADFVAQGATDDANIETQRNLGLHHVIGDNLGDITIKEDGINDECTDAYFAAKDIRITNSQMQEIILQRPYGKLRVIATDLAELNLNVDPKRVEVEYDACHPTTFNAVTGAIGAEDETKTLVFEKEYIDNLRANMANYTYNTGYDAKTTVDADHQSRNTHMTLFTDYILGVNEQQRGVSFNLRVYDQDDVLIKETEFNTLIPIQRNYLTTVIGNVLTTATSIEVSIDDNFVNKDREYYVFEAFVNGGVVDLDRDYVIGRTLYVEKDAVLNLNGFDIKNNRENGETDVIIVREGATLTINEKGNGTIQAVYGNDGYAVIAEGTVIINGGTFKSGYDANGESNATIYARGNGKVYINGGIFNTAGTGNDGKFILNTKDSDRATTTIEVRGGKFYNFNPQDNAAEGPGTNFVAEGYMAIQDGNWYEVVPAKDYEMFSDYMAIYTAKGMLKYLYEVNENKNLSLGAKLMGNINMPANTIAVDAANETYVFTDEAITVTDGVPSGSNWEPLCSEITALADAFSGHIDGQNYVISGLRIARDGNYVGLVGYMFDGTSIKNLTIDDAVIKGEHSVGAAAGHSQNGANVENVKVTNSTITGTNSVGGVVGYNYSRVGGAWGQGYTEDPAVVRNCSTDANTTVTSTGPNAGGIVGYNYGATIIECKNYADVTGDKYVGGICGYSRDYHHNKDGFIVACTSYESATITATQYYVGGIVGSTLADNQHTNTYMPIVACTSLSEIASTGTKGCIVGLVTHKTRMIACVALKNGATNIVGSGSGEIVESYLYDAGVAGTDAQVAAMNAEIADYNNYAPEEAKCNHKFVVTAGVPALQ